jgi:SAM-dependent methyltransferase
MRHDLLRRQLPGALNKAKPAARHAIQVFESLRLRGDAQRCPCCGWSFERFLVQGGEPNARCPRCGSLVRTRLLWTYLQTYDLLQPATRILHVAAELATWRQLRHIQEVAYVTGDINPGPRTSHVFDLTSAPFADNTFDLILMAHVLEHIPDDVAAMRELWRLLSPGGVALLQHPVDTQRTEIYEDANALTAEDRTREYGQWDHVRAYSRQGLVGRLEDAGFEVSVRDFAAELPERQVQRMGLRNAAKRPIRYDNDTLYVCRKLGVDAAST